VRHFVPIDGDPTVAITCDGQDIHAIGLKFHRGQEVEVWSNYRF
jgi:hypothetical protein